jgi:hypothetical protein
MWSGTGSAIPAHGSYGVLAAAVAVGTALAVAEPGEDRPLPTSASTAPIEMEAAAVDAVTTPVGRPEVR